MPQYPFKDELTGYMIYLYRHYDDFDRMPADDELPVEERGKTRKWVRKIAKNIKTTKSPSWGGGKGNW